MQSFQSFRLVQPPKESMCGGFPCPASVEASEKQSAEVEKWRGSAFPGQEGGRAQPRGRGGEGGTRDSWATSSSTKQRKSVERRKSQNQKLGEFLKSEQNPGDQFRGDF